jgi:hypothetical protein
MRQYWYDVDRSTMCSKRLIADYLDNLCRYGFIADDGLDVADTIMLSWPYRAAG